MDASDQVIFFLKVAINIAPVAVYFLVLGQVNSQAQPVLVNARADFQILTLVFVPLLAWPIPFLVGTGHAWLLAAGLGAAIVGFAFMVPGRLSGWVLYNVDDSDTWEIVQSAAAANGWAARRDGNVMDIPSAGLRIEVTPFALLRNVTLRVVSPHESVSDERFADFERGIREQLGRFSLLPTATGGCLMALGVSLMIVPLWLMSRHIDAIVEIVQRLFFA